MRAQPPFCLEGQSSDEVPAAQSVPNDDEEVGPSASKSLSARLRASEQRITVLEGELDAARREAQSAAETAADVADELAACRELAVIEQEALRADVEELEQQLRAQEATPLSADVTELQTQIGSLTTELAEAKMQAALSAAREEDARAELEALQQLWAQEEEQQQELQRQLDDAREAARPAQRAEAGQSREEELEAQVASLLDALAAQQAASDELLVLRPKTAQLRVKCDELERQLRDASNEGKAGDGGAAEGAEEEAAAEKMEVAAEEEEAVAGAQPGDAFL